MKFVVISDTHGLHKNINLPHGDVLIHCGDITEEDTKEQVAEFLEWFSALPYQYKIFIGGNHDFFLDRNAEQFYKMIPKNLIYLNNKGFQIGNIKLWGSPTVPDLIYWAFGKTRGAEMKEHWDYYLPTEPIDILITHTPPFGILDSPKRGGCLGCEELLKKVKANPPKYHLFGHIHGSSGILKKKDTTFINASIVHSRLGAIHSPAVFELYN